MSKEIENKDQCPTFFERRSPGKRYVNARWRCPRKKLKGLPYCSYCEPGDKKQKRLAEPRSPGGFTTHTWFNNDHIT